MLPSALCEDYQLTASGNLNDDLVVSLGITHISEKISIMLLEVNIGHV